MFASIDSLYVYPLWAQSDGRWCRLDALDRLLSGRFYSHLAHPFHQEDDGAGNYIPIAQRRPSVTFNLPHQVAMRSARKLFAGQHKPRYISEDQEVVKAADLLMKEGFLDQRMLHAAYWGSVGSVAITFKILLDSKKTPRIVYDIWQAKQCVPLFDVMGELMNLRIQYPTGAGHFYESGQDKDCHGKDLEPGKQYWFIRDLNTQAEINYLPVPLEEWTTQGPHDPDVDEDELLKPDPTLSVKHGLDFVPGHWLCNLSGGLPPDGCCTWEPAVGTSIEIDYTLSQMGRGIRYNAAPTLVIQGELMGGQDKMKIVRGPADALQFPSTRKAGDTALEGGDAKLLEMTGKGLEVAKDYVEMLRRYAQEQIQTSRKDPEKLATKAMSGAAMEMLEEDHVDLVAELRTNYGEQGLLPLTRKALCAAIKAGHPAAAGIKEDQVQSISLLWPKPFSPGAQDFVFFVQALMQLLEPKGGEEVPQDPAFSPDGKQIELPKKYTPGKEPKSLLSVDEARAMLESFVDIPHMDEDEGEQQTPTDRGSEPGYLREVK